MKIVTGKETKILRQPAKPVEKITPEIRELIREMKKTMKENGGIGLAAPQIGVNLQVFVAQTYTADQGYRGKFYAIINPKIISQSEQTDSLEEGCLSLPKIYGEVKRAKKITIEGLDELGRKIRIKASGLLARIFQHEIDHLNGTLFIDKSPKARRFPD